MRAAIITHRTAAAILLLALGGAGCEQAAVPKEAKKAPPAGKVEKLPGEADLTAVVLTPEAEERLGLRTVLVEHKELPRTRTLGGVLDIPPGRALMVSAPLSGTLVSPEGGIPAPGSRVKWGQVIFRLIPLLSPDAQTTLATTRVEAQGQVDQAEKALAQAKIQLDRAERLLRERIGSPGALEDAKAQYNIAQAALRAATERRDALDKTIRGVEGGTLEPLPIEAESDGILKNLHAQAGQKVNAGAMLFDVVSLDRLWVRVPVYVGDLPTIDTEKPAEVGGLADPTTMPTRPANPVPAPPTGDPLAATVDLFYEVENRDGSFRPGQRVGVTLPLRGERADLVVPRSALLRDFDGGAWVYEKIAPHKYARRRVRIDRIVGPLAALSAGPKPGTEVVAEGAAEVFGTEFGGSK